MNTIIISEYFYPRESGAEKNARLYAEDLFDQFNIKSYVLTKYVGRQSKSASRSGNYILKRCFVEFKYHRFSELFEYFVNFFILLYQLIKLKPDVINVIGYNAFFFISVLAGKLIQKPVILIMCTSDIFELKKTKPIHFILVKIASKLAYKFVSKSIRFPMKSLLKITDSKFITIANPAFSSINLDSLHRELIIKKENFINIGFTGKLHSLKNPIALIEMMKILNNPLYRLYMIGDGYLKNTIEKLIIQYNLGAQIQIINHQSELSKYLLFFDIYIFPTCYEPAVSQAMMEAMIYELPVIVRKSENLELWFTHKKDCFMTEDCSPECFADAVKYLVNNPKSMFEIGKEGRNTIQTNHSISDFTKIIYNINSQAIF